ncbi:MAG: AtpZ/AtpI family protein [Paracoccus sp. (in: a-proteobacteria)]|nr:AtpZ/AtpI family protein [Paracoccus sp. (in: a-proteobacteria)]
MTKPDQDSDAERAKRLRQLEERLAELNSRDETPGPGQGFGQAQHAWRMVTELVAGLAIGFGIGYGLDSLFGTMPVFLVIFIMAGLAAGVNVMMRTAKELGNSPGAVQENNADDPATRKRD